MMPRSATTDPIVSPTEVRNLWFHRQGLLRPRAAEPLTRASFRRFLNQVGAIQLDSVNVVERAHLLTLWSRFGAFDRRKLDRWLYQERVGYEYWGHEASILPIEHLPLGRRRMGSFPPPSWRNKSWWKVYQTSPASKRRVLARLRKEGPLETGDFEAQRDEFGPAGPGGGTIPLTKEDGRSLKLLWHAGRVAVHARRHFRSVYDLAERIYPDSRVASREEYEDSWLLTGLAGNGIAPERHLTNYITGPALSSSERKRVIARNLDCGRILRVRVEGHTGDWYALPQDIQRLGHRASPEGTTLICPFDSLLWQRQRAEELLDFRYRVEIYTPASRRLYGYYVMPILHQGRLVGRVDLKLHRDRSTLEVRSIHWESGIARDRGVGRGLGTALEDLADFLGADAVALPRGKGRLSG